MQSSIEKETDGTPPNEVEAQKSAPPSAATGSKRQRTLEDMFSAKGIKSVQPVAKKARTTTVMTSSASSSTSHVSQLPKLNSIPFSLSQFEAKLSEDEKRLLQLEIRFFGASWFKVLHSEFTKPYFLALKRFLWDLGVGDPGSPSRGITVYPPANLIYSWSNQTPLGRVKCVILGQDPYHGPGQAHGLCFSVPKSVTIPPSLHNIYKELKANYPQEFVIPTHGDLSAWARDGVLMLNTCLTVTAGKPGSHAEKGWEKFTEQVINAVDKWGGATLSLPEGAIGADRCGVGQGVVFLCWGAWAAKRVAKLSKSKHLILSSPHPSPLSAHRGFFGNNHFAKANEWLESKYGPAGMVNWCKLD